MNRLLHQVALISGGGNGIGEAIAMRFAREGCKVAILDYNKAAANRVVESIHAMTGEKNVAMAFGVNVTDEKAVNDSVAETVKAFGGVTCLVSNAGTQHISSIVDLEYSDWKKILGVHLDGSFLLTRAVMRRMATQHKDKLLPPGTPQSILLMGSVHSKLASKLKAPYVASKHALLGLTRVVAKEGAEHNIRSNLICPGYVLTDLVKKQIPEQASRFGITEDKVVKDIFLKDTVDGEFSTVKDVEDVAVFLASMPTNCLTGQSINVSHGWQMD